MPILTAADIDTEHLIWDYVVRKQASHIGAWIIAYIITGSLREGHWWLTSQDASPLPRVPQNLGAELIPYPLSHPIPTMPSITLLCCFGLCGIKRERKTSYYAPEGFATLIKGKGDEIYPNKSQRTFTCLRF